MHKYIYLYQQCENTFDYDNMIERLGKNRLLLVTLNVNCMVGDTTLFIKYTEAYNELIDFLDGNGFIIKCLNKNTIQIIPTERKYIIK